MSSDSNIFTAIPYEGFDALLGHSNGGDGGSWCGEKCSAIRDWFQSWECPRVPSCDCSLSSERKRQLQLCGRWTMVLGVVVLAGLGFGFLLGSLIKMFRPHHHHHFTSQATWRSPESIQWMQEYALELDLISDENRHLQEDIDPRVHMPHGFWMKSPQTRFRRHSRPDRLRHDDFFPEEDQYVAKGEFFPTEVVQGGEEGSPDVTEGDDDNDGDDDKSAGEEAAQSSPTLKNT